MEKFICEVYPFLTILYLNVQFYNGEFETDMPEQIEGLKKHSLVKWVETEIKQSKSKSKK